VSLRTDRYESLVDRDLITQEQLSRARQVCAEDDASMVSVLTSWFNVDQRSLCRELAAVAQLEFVDLDRIASVNPALLERVDRSIATEYLFAVTGPADGIAGATVAVSDPFDPSTLAAVRTAVRGELALVVATPSQISELLNRSYGSVSVHQAVYGLKESDPDDSASTVVTAGQKMFLGALVPAIVVFAAGATLITTLFLNSCSLVLYAAAAIFRVRLINLATDPARQHPSYLAPPVQGDRGLPTYTILVPMYREAAVVPKLLTSLNRLDYPPHKLDILLICEEDDDETVPAIRRLDLGSQFRLIVVPDALPKTKPKACNYALDFARGEMVVIFDAEDLPDSDQLRRVLAVFGDSGDDLACVQARLAYWNANTNLLTRWFAIEYTMWFDLILPGLEQVDAPVPLGGTSNHFRMEVLRELGGWDPFNVTEDADLGVRLHKRGYRTLNVDSTTLEEANSQLGNWIRQRSRWMKGHMQTWLVHNRNPRRTIAELGWRPYLAFQLLIGMGVLGALLNPFYWTLILIWAATQSGIIHQEFPAVVNYLAALNLLIWNFAFVYAAAAGVARRKLWSLVFYAFISPLYWVLLSWATWKGAIQLVTRPFYWEKTIHGLDEAELEPRLTPQPVTSA
jgi:cellulose synthase/poly-beta-1,6-N-acetylglucosamine synthase-like glycosyltransferase